MAEVTLAFWLMKICATTVGKTGGDLVSMTLKAGYAVSSLILLGVFSRNWVFQTARRRRRSATNRL